VKWLFRWWVRWCLKRATNAPVRVHVNCIRISRPAWELTPTMPLPRNRPGRPGRFTLGQEHRTNTCVWRHSQHADMPRWGHR
jgi:hypothetical protein